MRFLFHHGHGRALGAFRFRRKQIGAATPVLLIALAFDAVAAAAFTSMRLQSDPAIVIYALLAILAVFGFERLYRGARTNQSAR